MHTSVGSGFPVTPELSSHARLRCTQMGVTTKRVKKIMSRPTMTYANRGRTLYWSDTDPQIAVIGSASTGRLVAITVVPRTYEEYERPAHA